MATKKVAPKEPSVTKQAAKYGHCSVVQTPKENQLTAWIDRYCNSMTPADKVAATVMAQGIVNYYAMQLAKRDLESTSPTTKKE